MSKITICEGEILYTSKGDTIIHAFDGNITIHAQEKNIWEGKDGTLIGDYVPMELPKAEDMLPPPLTNIILNFLRNEDAGAFINQEFEDNGWKVIDASSIKNASIKLKAYLGNLKADNIYINTHGGSRKDPILDESGNKIPNLKTKRNDDFLTYENSAIRLGSSWIFASDFIEYVDAEKKKLLTEQTILD
ncbi:hypothetical protein [Chryseobacterium sp.]|uniref:hypothetical protein n=1 Tax=Chryseobacterium sp. TaxID=1871047 RepID=UPI00388EBD0D